MRAIAARTERALTAKFSSVSMGSWSGCWEDVSLDMSCLRVACETVMPDSASASLNSWALIRPSLFLSTYAAETQSATEPNLVDHKRSSAALSCCVSLLGNDRSSETSQLS